MPKKSVKKSVKKTAKKSKPLPLKKAVGRGGKRKGAGRPKGTGKFGCPTKAIRIPAHLKEEVVAFVMKKLKAENKAAK